MIKKIQIITLCFAFLSITSFGQKWKQGLKEIENPTFFDYQRVFNDYWETRPEEVKWRKGSGYKQFKRFEWFWAPRVDQQGNFPAANVLNSEWATYLKKHPEQTQKRTTNNTWTSLGPSTIASGSGGVGRINCIAFHPTDINTMWIGAPAGGLWKTSDGGATWSTNFDNMPVIGVSDIAIHPTDPNIMYVATGDADSGSLWGVFGGSGNRAGDTNSNGILKSTDGGETWTSVYDKNVTDQFLVRKLIIDPEYPDYVYAATREGILLTEDAGATWTNVLEGYFMDIERHPTNDLIFYAASFAYYSNEDAQVYVSTDGGYNWSLKTNLTGTKRINIEVTPSSPDVVAILCAESENSGLHSVQYSDDQGDTWTVLHDASAENLLGWEEDGSDVGGQGGYDLAFAIDPDNSSNLFVGGVTTWKSADAGDSWQQSSHWSYSNNVPTVHADKHWLEFHPLNSDILFECNDGGVWKSEDNGATWINLTDGLEIAQYYDIDCSQTDADLIVGGFQDNGSKIKRTGGWENLSGGDGMACQIDDQNGYIYSSYVNGEFYRHTTVGYNGYEGTISQNLPGGQRKGEWLTPFEMDPNDQSILYLGYDEVFKSTDHGDSWTQISSFNFGAPFNYLAIQPDNSDVIYAGYYTNVFKTVDGGTSWSEVMGLPANQNISRIVTSGSSDLLVTFSGYSDVEKVYHSNDMGATWTDITFSGLPSVPVNCAVMDKNSNEIYIGTDLGVYISTTNNTWERYGVSMPNVVISDLDIQYSSGKIRAATFGRGLWEIPLNTIPANGAPVVANQTFDIDEHSTAGAIVGTVEVSDPENDNLALSFSDASSTDAFVLDGASGEITVNDETQLDFETTPSFSYTVIANDGVNSATAIVTIELNDIDECASVALEATAEITASNAGAADGSIDISVSGGSGTYTYSWSNGEITEDISNLAAGTYTIEVTDEDGCGTSFTFTVDELIITGIDESRLFKIYPNPTSNTITISGKVNNDHIKLFNVDGKLIREVKYENQPTTIDLGLAPGIYYIKLGKETQKLIIE